jgi:hypothetical protein
MGKHFSQTLTRGAQQLAAVTDHQYAIIVYTIHDEIIFDGFYCFRDLAELSYKSFVTRYPNCTIHLVKRLNSEWRESSSDGWSQQHGERRNI